METACASALLCSSAFVDLTLWKSQISNYLIGNLFCIKPRIKKKKKRFCKSLALYFQVVGKEYEFFPLSLKLFCLHFAS